MTEFDDLLAGIRAHPTDELRRLVFADWLEEHAHDDPLFAPWASYIRWGVQSVRTPRTHPDYWKYRRYPEQPPRDVAKLLGTEGLPGHVEWFAGFPDTFSLDVDTLHTHDWRFATVAGPIRHLSIHARYETPNPLPPGYPAMPPQPPIPTSWVSGATVARAGELDVSLTATDAPAILAALAAQAGRLPPLSLHLPATSQALATLATQAFPSLVGLDLRDITSVEALVPSPNLAGITSLTLNCGNPPSPTAMPEFLRKMPQLRSLTLLGRAAQSVLPTLTYPGGPSLKNLELDGSAVNTPAWPSFLHSECFRHLERIKFISGSHDFADVPWRETPEKTFETGILNFNAWYVAGRSVQTFLSSPWLEACHSVFLDHVDLTSESYRQLAANPAARNLRVLSIQRAFKCEPVASGKPFAELCRSPYLANLTELCLTFHYFTDEDFDELLNATFADKLRYLNLAGSYFSEQALSRLLDPDVLPELTWLDVHGPKGENHSIAVGFRQRFGPNFAF